METWMKKGKIIGLTLLHMIHGAEQEVVYSVFTKNV